MQNFTTIMAIAVLIIAAYGDLRRRLIPNEVAIAVATLAVARMIIAGEPSAALWTLAAGAAVLFTGFVCFWRGWIGGGDAKLLSAVVLLVGYREVPDLLLIMSVVGGLLALLVLAAHKLSPLVPPLPVILGFTRAPLRLAAIFEKRMEVLLQLVRPSISRMAEAPFASARPTVPYGVAIAAAGMTVLVFQSSFPG